ncbi:MAG: hypothetical protein OXB96_01620 [Candidatus Kaiserbacteria bacterium]|nr:hypothetical protein [Candidatus Kaiserbacteria bacterium]
MRTVRKNLLTCLGVGIIAIAISGSLLTGRAQGQSGVQCESWLQSLLTSQNGIQYILSKISSVVAGKSYTQTATPPEQQAQTPIEPGLQAVSIGTKVTEKNNAYHKFAWVLRVKSNADSGRSFTAKIRWIDADGFVIDDDIAYNLVIDAGEEKQFTGYALVDVAGAETITSVSAEIPRRYVTAIETVQTIQPITAQVSK